ncbi:MAG: hypothetical protein HFH70_09525 [Lachnospiraceae bacterium]|nr:hypothetical protein [Lachnospiraceae bacterium]
MKKSSILYENIRIEMARKDKTILDIAKTVNMNRDTLSKKLSGRSKLTGESKVLIKNKKR